MKKVFLIHGWDGNPENAWFPWLKRKLKDKGMSVYSLSMPSPEKPEIEKWVGHLKKEIDKTGGLDSETFLVGHSIGCQTILRYLEKVDDNTNIAGIVLVAPFFNLPNLETEEERIIAKPWLENEIDFDKVRGKTGRIVCVFSTDDPFVPLSDSETFEKELGAKILVEGNKG